MFASGVKALCLAALLALPGAAVDLTGYEFVIVGSGAGGGPLAARLALAGKKTLLIEAGNDQGANLNYSVPAYQALSTEDPKLAWDFFVKHYDDETQARRDFKLTYTTPSGGQYIGLNPPAGSTVKGILYPRTNTLGGCTAHNALVTVYPDRADFDNLAKLTGDADWNATNLRRIWTKMENNQNLPKGRPGHGYNGWFYVDVAPLTLGVKDLFLTTMIIGAAKGLGDTLARVGSFFTADGNEDSVARDSTTQLYQTPIASNQGVRSTVREFLLSVANAKDAAGKKKYPLDIRLNSHVTKINFDTSVSPPKAIGVSFLDGAYLYRASPLSKSAKPGVPGTVTASKEVIISGGSYNSPQILKLSGIGPRAELQSFGIPVIKDSPGVGGNLQDHYEVVVQGQMQKDFPVLDGCTFGFNGAPDPCLTKWQNGRTPATRGTYASSGFAGHVLYSSPSQPDTTYDELIFGGPINFRGYFPGYSVNATIEHNWWSWDALKSHPQNKAGTVTLRSKDPLDVPDINYRYFTQGADIDLAVISESIKLGRKFFVESGLNFTERIPGPNVRTDAEIKQHIKDTAWGHHASSTCAIGVASNPNAVLDSSFRVYGVSGLRVVDASVYPSIPGTFTLTSTYLAGELAAEKILAQYK